MLNKIDALTCAILPSWLVIAILGRLVCKLRLAFSLSSGHPAANLRIVLPKPACGNPLWDPAIQAFRAVTQVPVGDLASATRHVALMFAPAVGVLDGGRAACPKNLLSDLEQVA